MVHSSPLTLLIFIGIIIAIVMLVRCLNRFKDIEQRIYNMELFLFNSTRAYTEETETYDTSSGTTPTDNPGTEFSTEDTPPTVATSAISAETAPAPPAEIPEESVYEEQALPADMPPIPASVYATSMHEIPEGGLPAATDISDDGTPAYQAQQACDATYPEEDAPQYLYDDTDTTSTTRPRNIERFIGVNLFSKIGILVLIAGIGFFVKYAIDNNWINETARSLLGIATGLGLWGIAYRLRTSYRNFSSILAGGGFAICFVTIAIAHNIYALLNPTATMCSLVILTAAMIAISLVFNRRELAMTAIIGGFIAPFIASNPDSSVTMLLGYVLILDIAMFAISMRRNWWELSAVATPLTWIITLIALLIESSGAFTILIFSILYFILFSLPLALVLNRNVDNQKLFIALVSAMLLNNFAFLAIGTNVIPGIKSGEQIKGLIPLIIATVNGAIYFRFYVGEKEGLIRHILTGLIVLFIALIFPIQFSSPDIILSCLACYGAILNLGYATLRNRLFGTGASIIGIIVGFSTLLSFDELSGLHTCRPWNIFTTDMICAVAFAASAWTVNRYKRAYASRYVMIYTLLLWTGALTALSGMDVIYNRYWDVTTASRALMMSGFTLMIALSITTSRGGNSGWTFPGIGAIWFGGSLLVHAGNATLAHTFTAISAALYIALLVIEGRKAFRDKITGPLDASTYLLYFNLAATLFAVSVTEYLLREFGLPHLYSAGLSVCLTLCGAIQLVIGLKRHIRLMRIIGLCVVGIVLIKLVVHDLWLLPTIGRIVVFILLGTILLLISFLYQKLRAALFAD